MRQAVSDDSHQDRGKLQSAAAGEAAEEPAQPPIAQQPRNFTVMAAYQILMRTGWIFKTESIIMPTVLDTLGFGGWLRGCLPLLNRTGQSLSPLLLAPAIKALPRKKRAVAGCTLVMAAAFLVLGTVWRFFAGAWWMPIAFLTLYTVFFISNGVNQLSVNTLQGKLVRINLRGRLLLVSNTLGAATAIFCAWRLLSLWLRPGEENFAVIFTVAGACFAGAAAASLFLAEPPDAYRRAGGGVRRVVASAWSVLRQDANFRRLAVCSMLYSVSLMILPHYQALGRGERVGAEVSDLILWIIVQNAGVAFFSLVAGPLADRQGNRLTLRLAMWGLCSAPLTAIALSHAGPSGRALFPLVFLLVGLTPIGIKTFLNYTLEIAPPEDHPRYISTLSVCAAAPLMLSPLVGLLVDVAGFDWVLGSVAILIFIGGLSTFWLQEPRRRVASAAAPHPVSEDV